jgi:hypothetical protein
MHLRNSRRKLPVGPSQWIFPQHHFIFKTLNTNRSKAPIDLCLHQFTNAVAAGNMFSRGQVWEQPMGCGRRRARRKAAACRDFRQRQKLLLFTYNGKDKLLCFGGRRSSESRSTVLCGASSHGLDEAKRYLHCRLYLDSCDRYRWPGTLAQAHRSVPFIMNAVRCGGTGDAIVG